jgi:hypothetical protein
MVSRSNPRGAFTPVFSNRRRTTRHPFARCVETAAVRRTRPTAPSYPTRAAPRDAPLAGKMLLTDSCNRPRSRAPERTGPCPRWPPGSRRESRPPKHEASASSSGHACLTTRTSFRLLSTRARDADPQPKPGSSRSLERAAPILADLRSRPSVLAPGTRRCLPHARRECRPLTLLALPSLRPTASPQAPAASRQRGRARLAPEAPSFDECPRCTDRSMLTCPPPRGGFAHLAAASDAPFASQQKSREARPRALDPLFTGRAARPHAARRRLPSADPQAPTFGLRPSRELGCSAVAAPRHPRDSPPCAESCLRSSPTMAARPVAKLQSGAGRRAFAVACASHLDGSRWKLLPERNRHRTPRVARAARQARRRA